jgi:membrane-bound lytic murein transglycosylase B
MLSTDEPSKIDIGFMTMNRIIYDYFSNSEGAFKADNPWLLVYDNNKVLLFNAPEREEFKEIKTFPPTNFLTQYKELRSEFPHDFTQDLYKFDDKHILYLHLDKDFYNLENLTDKERLDLLVFITQKLYSTYLKNYNRELTDFPSIHYPVTDVNNQIMSGLEYKLLLEAYHKDNKEITLEHLKQFYAIRINRWKTQPPFVETYELSQEKILGLSYYQAFHLLKYLDEITKDVPLRKVHWWERIKGAKYKKVDLPPSLHPFNEYNTFAYHNHVQEILNKKFKDIMDEPLIAVNAMSRQKAENVGFLLAYLYEQLGWEYKPETSKENFHEFLGAKLDLRHTEIDSIYNAYLETLDMEHLTELATKHRADYEKSWTANTEKYNMTVYFDHYTDDFMNPHEKYYINSAEQTVFFPRVNKYKITSPWLEIELIKHSFLYNRDQKNKNIQAEFYTRTPILIDNKRYSLNDIKGTMKFSNLQFNSSHINLKVKTPGEISYYDEKLSIKMVPRLRFYVEEEYWETIEELNRKLIEKGLPPDWLSDNVNNEKFQIYHNVVRHFTNLPEHQVARGERDQAWYFRQFGVDAKIKKGAPFREKHQEALLSAEARNGIHYELLMAIMAIETDYANPRYLGEYYTFGTLVSQYLLLPRRQRFALNELVALYQFAEKTDKETYYFIGSFAGAAGWGQFIPSSMNRWFVNANDNFPETDIYSIEDTLHSISNYLNKNGLNANNIDRRDARFRAVRAYNQSDAYANAVLYMYDELRKTRPRD